VLNAGRERSLPLTGFVAIIDHDRATPVTDREIEELANTHDSLRHVRGRHEVAAGDFARVIVLGGADSGLGTIERRDASWAASIGIVHRDGPLVGATPESLNGHFALFAHDADAEKVLVATDPHAFQPVYTAERNGRTYVSDSALVLAKHLGAQPSRLGILTFLRSGYHFGSMTNWEGVTRLEPGSYVNFHRGRKEGGYYWRPQVDRDVAQLGFDDAVEHTTSVALETCRQWLGESPGTWVDLTGGFDSRLLNLLLDRLGIPFGADTRGDYTGDERRIARRIAELKGWEWLDVTPPADWSQTLPDMLPLTVAWSDGHLDPFELGWVLWAHSQMSGRHQSVQYGGGGEHLRGFTWRQEFPRAGKTSKVNFDNWVDLRLIHPLNLEVFASDPTPEVRADTLARMKNWVEPYSAELNTTQCDLMYAYKMTGHFAIYRSADAAFIKAQVPLYAKEMFTTAISVDYRHRRNHRLVRHMISRLDRQVAAIETDSGGPAEPWRMTNMHRFAPYYTQLARKAVNKVGQKFMGRRLIRPPETGNWWCPSAARRKIIDSSAGNGSLSYETMRSAPLFDQAKLDALLQAARAEEEFADTGLLGRIVATELSLRAANATMEAA
jgi:asparagine synthase (glutamine-hydrolysing)